MSCKETASSRNRGYVDDISAWQQQNNRSQKRDK